MPVHRLLVPEFRNLAVVMRFCCTIPFSHVNEYPELISHYYKWFYFWFICIKFKWTTSTTTTIQMKMKCSWVNNSHCECQFVKCVPITTFCPMKYIFRCIPRFSSINYFNRCRKTVAFAAMALNIRRTNAMQSIELGKIHLPLSEQTTSLSACILWPEMWRENPFFNEPYGMSKIHMEINTFWTSFASR